MVEWWFASPAGDDALDGKSCNEIDFGVGGGVSYAWTTSDSGATGTLTETGGSGFAGAGGPASFVGLVFYLYTAEYGGQSAQYRITNIVDEDEIEMERVAGDSISNTGVAITNHTGPFETFGAALDAVKVNDRIHMKAGTYTDEHSTYDSVGQIQTAGTASGPIICCGYKDYPGDADGHWWDDNYRAIIKADTEGLSYCLSAAMSSYLYYVFAHMRFTGAGAVGVGGVNFAANYCINFLDCKFDGAAGYGLAEGPYGICYACEFEGNAQRGFSGGCHLIFCRFDRTGSWAAYLSSSAAMIGCVAQSDGQPLVDPMGRCVTILGNTLHAMGAEAVVTQQFGALVAGNLIFEATNAIAYTSFEYMASLLAHKNILGYSTAPFEGGSPFDVDNIKGNLSADDIGFTKTGGVDGEGLPLSEEYYRLKQDSMAVAAGWPASRCIGWDQRTTVDVDELHLTKALLCNKRTQEVSTGVVTVYDDDGTTPILTITPSETGGVITLTVAEPNAGTPGTAGTEMHQIKAFLANKRTHTIETAVDVVKDDDGSTTLLTLTPTENNGVVTVTPS